jgi:aminomethyltransferase
VLATLETQYAKPGTQVEMEVTVEYKRKKVIADVVKIPFFNPERKKT